MLFAGRSGREGRQREAFAKALDFASIFVRDTGHLYYLAFLLTGDMASAASCFMCAFESCIEEPIVTSTWATRWSRRCIIKAAIGIMSPKPPVNGIPGSNSSETAERSDAASPLCGVQSLSTFDRFVFVMSVLENQSKRECSLLLNCAANDVSSARIRACEQLASGSVKAVH
jgi:hypothetical protein